MITTLRSIDQAIAEDKVILLADPRIVAIPIHDNHELMIDLKDQTDLAYGPSPEIENNLCYTKMRKAVYEKLLAAQKMLPKNIKFCLYEGWRSFELQKQLYDHRYELIAAEHPDWSHEQIYQENIKMVSPVTLLNGEKNIPPHATGAAVDIYLTDQHGHPLEMGILAKNWMQDVNGILSYTHSDQISEIAQQNRKLMSEVLTTAGFINYATEYWHWSYGDRYWAYHTKHPHAIYGPLA